MIVYAGWLIVGVLIGLVGTIIVACIAIDQADKRDNNNDDDD